MDLRARSALTQLDSMLGTRDIVRLVSFVSREDDNGIRRSRRLVVTSIFHDYDVKLIRYMRFSFIRHECARGRARARTREFAARDGGK